MLQNTQMKIYIYNVKFINNNNYYHEIMMMKAFKIFDNIYI